MDAFHSEEHIIGDATILKNEGDLIENYARCASSCASICRMKWGASSLALRPDTRQPPRCEPILAGLQRSLSLETPALASTALPFAPRKDAAFLCLPEE